MRCRIRLTFGQMCSPRWGLRSSQVDIWSDVLMKMRGRTTLTFGQIRCRIRLAFDQMYSWRWDVGPRWHLVRSDVGLGWHLARYTPKDETERQFDIWSDVPSKMRLWVRSDWYLFRWRCRVRLTFDQIPPARWDVGQLWHLVRSDVESGWHLVRCAPQYEALSQVRLIFG